MNHSQPRDFIVWPALLVVAARQADRGAQEMSGFRFDRTCKKADVKMMVPMDAGGKVVKVPVTHSFEFESPAHLQDKYAQERTNQDENSAAFKVWQEHCTSVSGYEGLPPDFRNFFAKSELATSHAVSATKFLINKLGIQMVDP